MSNIIRKELDLAGTKLVLETGELAAQAAGAVKASFGETVVLATAVAQKAQPDVDFFPLTVDYQERLYAGGKISTSRFIKREGRPSEEAILTARLIDRSIRPLFPKDYQAEVQVIITVLSVDGENDPDVVSLIAASSALAISDIPWNGPIAGLRIGKQNGGFLLNPKEDEKSFSTLDLVLVSKKEEIVMIEATGPQVDEESIVAAVNFGLAEGKKVIGLIEELAKEVGSDKQKYTPDKLSAPKEKAVKDFIGSHLIKELANPRLAQDENWFSQSLEKLEKEFLKEAEEEITSKILSEILDGEVADFLRKRILVDKKRIDGRGPNDIRPISIKVGILPRTHGSALFQRGATQVLSIATLASPALEQLIEGMAGEATKRYMHHYNFPPYSAGEVRRLGPPGRREIGHGSLAERALTPTLPSQETFPYTIRVVSEVLSSAGSTSMASACGSSLALMDAGVPVKEPVAGISIGLITDKNDQSKYVTLTDIAYQEDAQGDMDFKVAGTKNGVTAIQMDVKLNGISPKIVQEALNRAKTARLSILDKMLQAIPQARERISPHAPTVILVKIDPTKIGEVIGSGGRTINKIIAETGVDIDIKDDGIVTISGKDSAACQKAAKWVEGIVKEAQPGEVYDGLVKRILPFGAMVEILPGKEGLVHISRLAPYRVNKVEDVVKVGQTAKVRVTEIDDMGRVNLSMNFGADAEKEQMRPRRESADRPRRSGMGGGRFDRRQNRDRGPRKRY